MFKPEKDFTYLMPIHFGGGKFDADEIITQTVQGLNISYETDKKILENFIPEGFELLDPVVDVGFAKFTEINWMYGGQYNVINVGVPVRFHGKKEELDGIYTLVLWENKTAPILGGREQTGQPKIFADIEDLHVFKPKYTTNASYEGNTFLNIEFEETEEVIGDDLETMNTQFASINNIGWRYIPKVGGPGADLSQFILYPQSLEIKKAQIGKGSLKWTEMTPMQNPSQWWIINSLAALPIKKITKAVLTEGNSILRSRGSRILE